MKPLFNSETLEEAAKKAAGQNAFAILKPEGPSTTLVAYHAVLGTAQIISGSKKSGVLNIATGCLLGAIKCTKNENIRSMLAIGVTTTSTGAFVAGVKKHGLINYLSAQTVGALTCFTIDTINNYVDLEDKPKQ